MADIVENEELDRDTVEPEVLKQLFSKNYKLLTETTVSLKKSYIKKLDGTKSLKLAVSLIDNSIEIYQLSESSLSRMCRLSGHQKCLTELVFSTKDEDLLYSSGEDGLLRLWDLRAGGSCVQEYKDAECEVVRPYECMDVSCTGRVLCAGSQLVQDDAYIVFWDQRVPTPLGGYWNSHTDDITQVKFSKERGEVLCTGALDGLVNVFHVSECSEEEALTYSLPADNSVERLSWVEGGGLVCVTQAGEVRAWSDAGDLVRDVPRDKVARAIKRSRADECYVVDVVTCADGAHALLAGSHAPGDVLRSVSLEERRLVPRTDFVGNTQVVRCCWYHPQTDVLVTAGEAGVVHAWRGQTTLQ